jgi:hypothetical protein
LVEINGKFTCDVCGNTAEAKVEATEIANEGSLPHVQPTVEPMIVCRVTLTTYNLTGGRRLGSNIYCERCAPLAVANWRGSHQAGRP